MKLNSIIDAAAINISLPTPLHVLLIQGTPNVHKAFLLMQC